MMRSVLIGLVLLDATFAKADPVSVRVGDHPTFGRLVIHLSAAAPASVKLRGNRVEIGIANTEVGTPDRVPRNVIAFAGGHNAASISVVPGARIRSSQVGEMLIIDVVDPASRLLAETGRTRINPASTLPTLPPQMVAERSTRMPAAAPEPQPPPAVEPASPPALAGPVIPKPAVVEPEIAEAVAPEPVAASPLPRQRIRCRSPRLCCRSGSPRVRRSARSLSAMAMSASSCSTKKSTLTPRRS